MNSNADRMIPAIEYIRQTQHTERALQHELQRLQRDADYAREAHKENEMLKTEIQVMHQHLRRLDGNATHVYGHFTQQLNAAAPQQGAPPQAPSQQANGSISLPPLGQGGPSSGAQGPANGAPGPAAMQGVEYGGYGR